MEPETWNALVEDQRSPLQRGSPGWGARFDEANVIPELDDQGGSFFQHDVIALFEQSQQGSDPGTYSCTHSHSLEASIADGTNGPSGYGPAGSPGGGGLPLVS